MNNRLSFSTLLVMVIGAALMMVSLMDVLTVPELFLFFIGFALVLNRIVRMLVTRSWDK